MGSCRGRSPQGKPSWMRASLTASAPCADRGPPALTAVNLAGRAAPTFLAASPAAPWQVSRCLAECRQVLGPAPRCYRQLETPPPPDLVEAAHPLPPSSHVPDPPLIPHAEAP